MSDDREAAARLEELLGQRDPDDNDETGAAGDTGQGTEVHGDATPDAPETDSPDTESDDHLPDAPLFALLRIIEAEIGVDRIDRVWIFPPRRFETGETALAVVSAYPELDPERRRVYAAHYTAPAQEDAPHLTLREFGTAPTERVGRVVEEVVERLKEQPTAAPQAARIDGSDLHWNELLHSLAEKHMEEAARHPRFHSASDPRRR
jgi:hypothetical protein